jgi:DNA polymerase-3 subunit epsilon
LLDFDFEPEAPGWSKRIAAFDLETTGLDLKTARIVTACVVVIGPTGEVENLREWIVNPGIEIPQAASDVHGVTTEVAVRDGMDPLSAVAEISQELRKLNAPYDFTILANEAIRYQLEPLEPQSVIDPLVLDRKVDKFRKGKRNLVVMSEHYGVELTDAHNSTADAVAAGKIAQQIAKRFAELDIPIESLHDAQARWSDEQSESFAKFMRQQNRPDFQAELGWPIRL